MGNTYNDATGVWTLDGTTGNLETAPVTITRVFVYPSADAGVMAFTDTSDNELFSLSASDADFGRTLIADFTGEHGGGRKVPSLKVGTATNATANLWIKKTEYATTKNR